MTELALLVEHALNGCALGALYALCGMAIWLAFTVGGVANAALAGVTSLAALAGLAAMTGLRLPFLVALVVATLAGAVLGMLVEWLAFQPLRRRHGAPPPVAGLPAALAAWFVLDGLARLATGGGRPLVPPAWLLSLQLRFGEIDVPLLQILVLMLLAVAGVALARLLRRTRFGIALRAASENTYAAALAGMDVPAALTVAAGVAGALCGLAGLLGAAATANLSAGLGAGLGAGLMLKGLAAAAAGGRWGLSGVIAAAMALGLLEVACTAWSAFALRDALAFAVLLAALLFGSGALMAGGARPAPPGDG